MTADVNNLPKAQSITSHITSHNMRMVIDGNVVEYGPRVADKDPADGIETTYVPIWYVQQALNRIGIQSEWNGTNLKLGAAE